MNTTNKQAYHLAIIQHDGLYEILQRDTGRDLTGAIDYYREPPPGPLKVMERYDGINETAFGPIREAVSRLNDGEEVDLERILDGSMLTRRKAEILVGADFSLWRLIPRGYQTEEGLRTLLSGVWMAMDDFSEGTQTPEEHVTFLKSEYQLWTGYYGSIPFDKTKMDPEDPDFKFLWDWNEKLDSLGAPLEAYCNKCQQDNQLGAADWTEFKEVREILDWLIEHDYREQVLRKYGLALTRMSCEKPDHSSP